MNNEYKLTTAFELEVLSVLVVLPLIHYEIQIYDQLNKVKGAEKKTFVTILYVKCFYCQFPA